MDPRADPASLLPLAGGRYDAFMDTLAAAVSIDSGSTDASGVNAMADLVTERLRTGGWEVERRTPSPVEHPTRPGGQFGDTVIGRRAGNRPREAGGRRILLMAHMDTVFDRGTAAERPFVTRGERAHGPGVIDDKAGLVAGIEAVELLTDDAAFDDFAELVLVCTPDEEVGSVSSRPVLTELARSADVALGLEAARRNGDLVTARKGMAALSIEITGRASHAGVAPDQGVNAALEAAHKTIELQALNGRWPGVTCNVGVVTAGTRSNVVADRAVLQVDLRAATVADFERAREAVEAITATSHVRGTSAVPRTGHVHVPMERTPANAALVGVAADVARELGFTVGDQATGGCGDANISTQAGTVTIDGLGPIGGDAHASGEWLDLTSVVPRTALLAGLLARLGGGS